MITPLPPHPVAMMPTQKTMVIADLHIGWELALSEKGIYVPTQTYRLLKKLDNLISTYKPEKLVVLGDVKHTIATAGVSEWRDIPGFFGALKQSVRDIVVVRGNHDGNLEPLLPENVTVLPATGIKIGRVGFFHGHRWPSPLLLTCEILVQGHIHPLVFFRDPSGFRITKRVWVKAKCDTNKLTEILLRKHKVKIENSPAETLFKHYKIRPKTLQLLLMPAFNEFLGGKPLNLGRSEPKRHVVGPVLRSEAVDVENAETYLLDGTFIGRLRQINTFI